MDRRYDVFISYNSADRDVVRAVADHLRREHVEPWLDVWILTPGRSWQEEIVHGLAQAKTCAVMVGPSGLGDWAREELAVAHDRAAKDRDFRLFLVLLPGAPEIDDPRLAFLRTRTWVDLRHGVADPDAFQDLISAITGSPRSRAPDSDIDDGVSPYRGLAPFEEEHAEYFFGRETDTSRVLELLKESRFVAIVGASGTGKSSLVRAGVVRALRAGRLPGTETWPIRVFTPGVRPLTALAAQVGQALAGESMQTTLAALRSDERSLDLAATAGLADSEPGRRLVLVADQFEELFTLCTDEAERASFIGNLLYAATIPGGRVVVVVGMRADFYHRCTPYPDLCSHIASEQHLVGQLTPEGLRRAIEEPARLAGVELEAGLLETILADIGAHPGGLPLLQHVLWELWHRRRGRMLTLEAYVAAGRLEGSLAKRANAVYEGLSSEEQVIARRVLLRLVQPGEGTEDTRRRAPVDELVSRAHERAGVEQVVEALARERLLTSGQDPASGKRMVTITHEALIRGWPELRTWITEHREQLRAERRLTEAAIEWDIGGRDDSHLYRGARLSSWGDRDLESLNEVEREFLRASRRRETSDEAARRRRVRTAVTGVVAATLLVAVVALAGLRQVARERDLAGSRLVAANARAQLDVDPQQSLLLAREAYRLRPTADAEMALREAALASSLRAQASIGTSSSPVFSGDGSAIAVGATDGSLQVWRWAGTAPPTVFPAHNGHVTSVEYSRDGRTLVSSGSDGTIRLTNVTTGEAIQVLGGQTGPVNSARMSPDGRLVASVGSVDGTVRMWDVTSARQLRPLEGHEGQVGSVSFSPDGLTLATTGADGAVRIWDVAEGREIRVLRGHTGSVMTAAFSRDGKRIVSGGAADGTVRVWDLTTGEPVVLSNDDGPVFTVAFSPDGSHVAGAGTGSTVNVWDWRGNGVPRRMPGNFGLVNGVTFSPDGELVATTSVDQVARVWEWKRGAVAQTLQMPEGRVFGTDWSPNGRMIAAGAADGNARIWEWTTGAPVAAVGNHRGAVTSVAFLDDRTLVSSGVDGTIRISSLVSGVELRTMSGHAGAISDIDTSPDGRFVASTGFDSTVRVWDRATGAQLRELRLASPSGRIAFSPDGTLVAAACVDGNIRILDWGLGTERKVLPGHRGVANGVAFRADGRLIVTAGFDGTVRLNEWDGRGEIMVLRGHQGAVGDAGFSADGALAVSSGVDGAVRVWDVATGRAVLTLRGHRRAVIAATFSPVDNFVLSAGLDGFLRIWSCETCGAIAEVLPMAGSRAVRTLTQEERNNFLPQQSETAADARFVVLMVLAAAGIIGGGWLLYRTARRAGRQRLSLPPLPRPLE